MEQIERATESSEYLDAFLRLRTARGWLMRLLLLALVLNIGLCVTARFTSLLDRSAMFQSDLETLRGDADQKTQMDSDLAKRLSLLNGVTYGDTKDEAPTPDAPVPQPPEAPPVGTAAAPPVEPPAVTWTAVPRGAVEEAEAATAGGDVFYQVMHVALPMARVGGLFCTTLLVLVLLMSLKVVLLGRLKGVAYLTSAVLWSLVLLILVIPWNQAFAGFPVPGVLFGAGELIEGSARVTWGAQGVGWEHHLLYWMRFIGYPVLALVLWLTIQVQYARSYRPMVAGLQAE